MKEVVTVRQMIQKLIQCDMEHIILIRDVNTKEVITDCEIVVRPQEGITALFG
jgi:hypothetical protein